ncbi:MAG: TlpA family protein disulfide reductase [Actinobacteria bacterium]|nr:TlpA family protein disulfide reductase [Actinomycetota bacterium]
MSPSPTSEPSDITTADAPPSSNASAKPRRSRRITGRVVLLSMLVALCVALTFSFVALRLVDPSVGVDPADALGNLAARPAVPPGTPVATEGSPAPPVDLEYLDGGRQSIAELQGKPLLLNFWSSTCPPCITEMPVFQRIAERAGPMLQVVGIDVVDTPDAAQRQIARTGVEYRNAADPSGSVFSVFGGTALPRTVLIGADGKVLEGTDGALDDATLLELLRRNGVEVP